MASHAATEHTTPTRTPWWAWIWPLAAWILLVIAGKEGLVAAISAIALIGTIFVAVYHAEVVAHFVGEPFGTLVLAVGITLIETALIVSLMVAGGAGTAELARDTVFAGVMIACNGIVGVCLLAGGLRYREQGYRVQGANAALAVLAALTVLTLILPNVTTSAPAPFFSTPQLLFASAVSLILYGSFVFMQTVTHRDYFILVESGGEDVHAPPPSGRTALASAWLLLASLVAVVGLAKALTPALTSGVAGLGLPEAVVGIIIAALVLLPEGLAALRAARANQLQTAMNLALGSALASIGLTIPAVAVVSIVIGLPLALGLDLKEEVLLGLTLLAGVVTLGTGRTTALHGMVHLVIFAAFLFVAAVP